MAIATIRQLRTPGAMVTSDSLVEQVGASTLGDLTFGELERLFNALPRCPRACVVVTNLKDDV